MKKLPWKKIGFWSAIILPSLLLLFVLGVFIFHSICSSIELKTLKEKGYYNLVSVGDYRLNVAKFGNPNGEHTIVGMAGLGMGDYSVAMRKVTKSLEKDNYVVFVDRAGYGFSDDTNKDMTLENIVEDYRKALKNDGINGPYILMPHSIGGAYANYWVSNYPDEIEAIVFVDGSQLSSDVFNEEPDGKISFGDKLLSFMAKLGMSRFVLRNYFYHYPDNFTQEEQYLADALMYRTLDSIAPISEDYLLKHNAQKAFNEIVTNTVPKLYICASWGIKTVEELNEYNKWINRQIEINDLDIPVRKTDYTEDDPTWKRIFEVYEEGRNDTLVPYMEKMGNAQMICLSGDHMIYEQKPEECLEIIVNFLNTLS